jgi:hypothetical protein
MHFSKVCRSRFFLLALALLVFTPFTLAQTQVYCFTVSGGPDVQLVTLINTWRTSQGLSALAPDPRLTKAAQLHSADMATAGVLSHTGSDGSTFSQRIQAQGYSSPAGELIGAGYTTASAIMLVFTSDQAHLAILSMPTLTQLGISMVNNYWTVDFGSATDGPVCSAQGPSPVPVPFINQPLYPAAAAPGGHAFTIIVNGTGFVSGSVVTWNGSALPTTFVNSDQLTAAVPAADIANPGTAWVTVWNGGVNSNVAYFEITYPRVSVSFQPVLNFYAGANPNSVAVGDFNGDGKLDLAIADGLEVMVLLGNGDGTFLPAVAYVAGKQPLSVAVGDFNGDGKLDLVVANDGSNNVSVLLGNGDGTFQAVGNYAVGLYPISVAVGDFNGDGKLDFVVANDGSPYVSV